MIRRRIARVRALWAQEYLKNGGHMGEAIKSVHSSGQADAIWGRKSTAQIYSELTEAPTAPTISARSHSPIMGTRIDNFSTSSPKREVAPRNFMERTGFLCCSGDDELDAHCERSEQQKRPARRFRPVAPVMLRRRRVGHWMVFTHREGLDLN